MTNEFPPHIEYALKTEENFIELRVKQIEGYKARISLMRQGKSYGDTQQIIKPIHPKGIHFEWEKYKELKNEWMKNNKKEKRWK